MLIGHAITLTLAQTDGAGATTIIARLAGLTGGEARDGATIGVTVTGAPAGSVAAYRWQQNGTDIPGATGDTEVIEIGSVHVDDGQLRCVVTIGGVDYLSDPARMRHAPGTLSVADPPAWTVEDTSVNLDASAIGAQLIFSDYQLSGLPHLAIDASTGAITGTISFAEYQAQSGGTATVTCRDQYGRLYIDDFVWSAALRVRASAQNGLSLPDWTVDDDMVDIDTTVDFTANGNMLSYAITGLPTGLADDGDGSISGTPTVDGQTGTITSTATDEFARETVSTATFTTAYRTQATAANGLGPFTWTVEDTSVSVNVASDFASNGNTLTFTATGLPAGVSIAPNGTITGTPAAASDGPIVIEATDEYGRRTTSTTSHVTALRAQATAAGGLGPYGWPVGIALIGVSVTGDFTTNGNTLTYTATGLPAGVAIAPDGTISGTPTAASTGTIVITGTDEYGRQTTSTATLTTTLRSPATAAGGLGPYDWTVDETAVSIDAAADFTTNGNTLTYSATGLPSGLSIATNGVISGMPTALQSGTVTITGLDEYGRDVTSTFTFGTSYRAPATAANALGPFSWTVGDAIAHVNAASDFTYKGNTLTFTATGLPAGISIAPDGSISGTPTAESSGTIVITGTDEYGRTTTSTTSHTTTVSTLNVMEEPDGTISVSWTGTLDSITVGGGGVFDGTYTMFHDGTALIDTHLDGVAGRALVILPTTGTGEVGQTLTAGDSLVLYADGQADPAVSVQWQRDGVDIPGATGTTYTLVSADEATNVRPTFIITSAGLTTVTEAGSAVLNIAPAPDTTAPILSVATDAADGQTASTGSVTTDEGNGTLYWVVTTSATAPSAAQVKAGQDNGGVAAAASGSQSVSGTGVQTLSPAPSGLTAGTAYTTHFMHEDAASNQSAVASAGGFTTAAAAPAHLLLDSFDTGDGYALNDEVSSSANWETLQQSGAGVGAEIRVTPLGIARVEGSGGFANTRVGYTGAIGDDQFIEAEIEYPDGNIGNARSDVVLFCRYSAGAPLGSGPNDSGVRFFSKASTNEFLCAEMIDNSTQQQVTVSGVLLNAGDKVRIEVVGTTAEFKLDTGSGFSTIATLTGVTVTGGVPAFGAYVANSGDTVQYRSIKVGEV